MSKTAIPSTKKEKIPQNIMQVLMYRGYLCKQNIFYIVIYLFKISVQKKLTNT